MKATKFKKVISILFNKRVAMLLFFLVIAFIAWFANRLSNDYRATLELNVRLYSSTNPTMPQMSSCETLPIVAKANGFFIIQKRLNTPTVYIDINPQKLRGTAGRRYLLVSSLKSDIARLLSDDMQIESYGSDTLYFRNVDKAENPIEGTIYGDESGIYLQENPKN